MEPVVGVFATRKQAEEATERLRASGLKQVILLTPDDWTGKVHHVRTEDAERGGMGAVLCGLVGGALGVAGGLELGILTSTDWAAGSFALQLLCAATLGAGGIATGIAAGHALESAFCDGMPIENLYMYEGALRRGRSVVIASANRSPSAAAARDLMSCAGAESVDAACQGWWFRRRQAEEKLYRVDA
jgi:hypothetical protein